MDAASLALIEQLTEETARLEAQEESDAALAAALLAADGVPVGGAARAPPAAGGAAQAPPAAGYELPQFIVFEVRARREACMSLCARANPTPPASGRVRRVWHGAVGARRRDHV